MRWSRWRAWLGRVAAQRARFVEVLETTVLCRELDRPVVSPSASSSPLEVVQVPAGGPLVVALSRRERARVRPCLARGDAGFIALDEGRAVGWIWLSRVSRQDPNSGLHIRLAPDEGYAYYLWTRPEARQAGAGPALVTAMLSRAQADPELTRIYGWVDRDNRRSQVLLRMLGFTEVQSVRRVQVLRRRGWVLGGPSHIGRGQPPEARRAASQEREHV